LPEKIEKIVQPDSRPPDFKPDWRRWRKSSALSKHTVYKQKLSTEWF